MQTLVFVGLSIFIIIALIVIIIKRNRDDSSEIKVVRLKDIKSKGMIAEIEEELEHFERIDEEEENEKSFDEIVVANEFGEIVFTTGRESLVDPFYVFPYAKRIIVESDKYETFVKLDDGFIYIRSNAMVDERVAKRIAKRVIRGKPIEVKGLVS